MSWPACKPVNSPSIAKNCAAGITRCNSNITSRKSVIKQRGIWKSHSTIKANHNQNLKIKSYFFLSLPFRAYAWFQPHFHRSSSSSLHHRIDHRSSRSKRLLPQSMNESCFNELVSLHHGLHLQRIVSVYSEVNALVVMDQSISCHIIPGMWNALHIPHMDLLYRTVYYRLSFNPHFSLWVLFARTSCCSPRDQTSVFV